MQTRDPIATSSHPPFTLPVHGLSDVAPMIEAAGGFIGSPLPDDPLFVACALPCGWRMRASGRPCFTLIVDESGRVRAEVFYRRDALGRVAHVWSEPRFAVRIDPKRALQNQAVAVVYDGGLPVWETASIEFCPDDDAERLYADEAVILAGRKWLDKEHNGWRAMDDESPLHAIAPAQDVAGQQLPTCQPHSLYDCSADRGPAVRSLRRLSVRSVHLNR